MAGESASEGSEEAVVCLSAEHATTDAACDGAHDATVTLLAVGIVRVAVGVVRVGLAVLVTLGATGR